MHRFAGFDVVKWFKNLLIADEWKHTSTNLDLNDL